MLSKIPSKPGIYTLVIKIVKPRTIQVGRLGFQRFPIGVYVYTGSALGEKSTNLKNRIERHLRQYKTKHWHIDYLLSLDSAEIVWLIYLETRQDMECKIFKAIEKIEEAVISIDNFGSSDCRFGCQAHLLYFQSLNLESLTRKIKAVYPYIGQPIPIVH